MRVENRILLIAFFLLLILASSAGHDDGLRGGSRDNEDNREVQLPSSPTVPSFFAYLWSLLRRIAAAVVSVPAALLQFLLSVLFSFWNFVFGIFLSISAPLTTMATKTTTLVPTTATSTLAATTSSAFFSTEMTNPATTSSAGTAMTTVPTALTSTLLSTSAASTSTSTASTSTSTSSSSTSTSSTSTSTSSTSTSTTGTTTSTILPPLNKTVFITSFRFSADLGEFGGLDGGDSNCNAVAQSVNLPGNFFAWLSNATHSPNTRFTRSLGPYVLTNGAKFADNYAALISGGPLVPLNIQENKVEVLGSSPLRRVWTGTDADGNATINHCNNWRSNSNAFSGTTAEPRSTDSPDWTDIGAVTCDEQRRLYCFEQ